MKKKKILFLINTLTGGGAEKVLVDLVNNMDKDKYEITVQTMLDIGVHKKSLNKNINYKTIVKVKNKFISKLLCYILSFVLSSKIVYNLFVKSDFDYEIAFLEGVPTKIIGASTNKNSIKYAWVHTDLYNNFSGHEKIFKKFDDYIKCYKKFDKIICVSESVKESFNKKFKITKKLEVIYNLYDEKKIERLSLEVQNEIYNDDTLKIISVGRLCEQKGFRRLLEVHQKLIINGYMHHLYILGEGGERKNLERYIYDYNLNNSVTLLGFKENPYKYMRICDIFVCSSLVEGFSTVTVESIILGIPVISTAVSGANEILGNSEFGVLVDNHTESLYEGLKQLISNQEKRSYYKSKAIERAGFFEIKRFVLKIEEIFK